MSSQKILEKHKICILPGDGIGPEVMDQAKRVIDLLNTFERSHISYTSGLVGGHAIDELGEALPKETLRLCEESDAILFGSVGGEKWDHLAPEKRPERAALLKLRGHFKLYANLRPSFLLKELKNISPLRGEIVEEGMDLLCIRELTGGLYFGEKGTYSKNDSIYHFDTMAYSRPEIERVTHLAFSEARKRKKKVTSIDKANVLDTMVLWREVVSEIAKEYPDVECEHLYVDNAAMQLILRPSQFDVLLCPNMFGDILSDECAVICGSMGLLPSASLGMDSFGLYEPAGGSAPSLTGKNMANPISQILSTALMYRYSLGNEKAAEVIESSVTSVLKEGVKTKDLIYSEGEDFVSTEEMGSLILKKCERLLKGDS